MMLSDNKIDFILLETLHFSYTCFLYMCSLRYVQYWFLIYIHDFNATFTSILYQQLYSLIQHESAELSNLLCKTNGISNLFCEQMGYFMQFSLHIQNYLNTQNCHTKMM